MPKKAKNPRSRGWCFTIQSWSELDCATAMELYENDNNCTYLIVGFEHALRTNREHLQCYVYYTNPVRESEMRNKLVKVHIEPQKAKLNVKAYCYCMEEWDYFEVGQRPRQGHRTDLEVIKHDLITKKKTIRDVSVEYFSQWCQYSRQFDRFVDMNDLRNTYDTKLVVYNDDSIKDLYELDLKDCRVEQTMYWIKSEILHMYYSKKYRVIYIPDRPGIEELSDLVTETLY